MATIKTKRIPVLITTERRGVFFGYIDPAKRAERTLDMEGVRNCISWSSSVGGFAGLAERGPNSDCRIGAKVSGISTFHLVECVLDVTPEAVKAWEAASCVK